MLKFRYRSKFFGQDIINTLPEKQRAFISTYQGLGYLRNGHLIIQSPVKNIQQYVPVFSSGSATPSGLNDTLANEAIAWYQSISWLLKHKKQSE